MSVKFSEDVVPLTDLEVDPGGVVKHAVEAHRPILLTSRGRGVRRLQSLADYEQAVEERAVLRELIHPPFRIVYRRDPERVQIVRVWRSERLLRLPASTKYQDLVG